MCRGNAGICEGRILPCCHAAMYHVHLFSNSQIIIIVIRRSITVVGQSAVQILNTKLLVLGYPRYIDGNDYDTCRSLSHPSNIAGSKLLVLCS